MTPASSIPLQEDLTLLARPGPAATGGAGPLAWWLVAAGLVVVVALVVLWLGWRRKKLASGPRGESPDVAALRGLAEWGNMADAARHREAVAAISGIVRRYTAARFGLRATTLTNEEFWAEQQASRSVPAEHDAFWQRFLAECAWTIYAGHTPSKEALDRLLLAAIDFVQSTKAERVAPDAPSDPAETNPLGSTRSPA